MVKKEMARAFKELAETTQDWQFWAQELEDCLEGGINEYSTDSQMSKMLFRAIYARTHRYKRLRAYVNGGEHLAVLMSVLLHSNIEARGVYHYGRDREEMADGGAPTEGRLEPLLELSHSDVCLLMEFLVDAGVAHRYTPGDTPHYNAVDVDELGVIFRSLYGDKPAWQPFIAALDAVKAARVELTRCSGLELHEDGSTTRLEPDDIPDETLMPKLFSKYYKVYVEFVVLGWHTANALMSTDIGLSQ